ncbi:hypothetical protein PsAD2_03434 [Pseudovibrio axinellae]|uniref:Phasin domain-containing protein n=1 Tax=Pseudovibrio axinellae TaxID=989403 RepID=A0A161VB45_9HYPH|nr:phasin family protein [Pseudovibrio axinellae]KZL16560.1 hypothetical protein PsAD2_03434 [Pseudovibrio axinellae]SEQ15766.1 Phasin protein [Pseudovibrio axinellae]
MLNIDKDIKEAMDRWSVAADSLPWQGWFWAQGGDQLSSTALENAIYNNKAMLENCQAILNANMSFLSKRMKANTDFVQEMWNCPTGIEFSHLASKYMQQAFVDCYEEGSRQAGQVSSTMQGTLSKTQEAASDALTSIDDLKAMAQAKTAKAPAKPRRRAPRKSAPTRSREKNTDTPSTSQASGGKGVTA